MAGNFNIAYAFRAVDNFSATMKKINMSVLAHEKQIKSAGQRLKAFGATTARMGKSLTTKLTLPILALGALTGRTLFSFETQMNNVKAITQSTGEQFLKLRNQAREMGKTTRFTATQSAEAQAFLAKAGFKVDEIYNAMPHTLRLAAAANLDIASSADIVSNVMKGYRLQNEEIAKGVDVLTKTFVTSNTDLLMLGDAFKYAGPVAKGFGLEIEETTAFLGLLGNAGIQASMAGTSLRGALSKLASPSKKAAKILKDAGIQVFNAQGKMAKLHHILGKLAKSGATAKDIMEIFGLRAGPGMIALGNEATDAIEKYIQSLRDSKDIAKRIADTQLEGLPGAILLAISAVSDLMIAMGDAGLTAAIIAVSVWIIKLANYFSELSPAMQKTILIIGGIVAAIGPLMIGIGVFIKLLGIATIGFKAFWVAATGPFGKLIFILGIFASIGAFAYKHWEAFRNLIDNIVARFKEAIKLFSEGKIGKGLWKMITATTVGVIDTVKGKSKDTGKEVVKPGLAQKSKADKSTFEGTLNIAGAPKGSTLKTTTTGVMDMNIGLNMEGAY